MQTDRHTYVCTWVQSTNFPTFSTDKARGPLAPSQDRAGSVHTSLQNAPPWPPEGLSSPGTCEDPQQTYQCKAQGRGSSIDGVADITEPTPHLLPVRCSSPVPLATADRVESGQPPGWAVWEPHGPEPAWRADLCLHTPGCFKHHVLTEL